MAVPFSTCIRHAVTAHAPAFAPEFRLAAVGSHIRVVLQGDANRHGDALARISRLPLRFEKAASGWTRWLEAVSGIDFPAIATTLKAALAEAERTRQERAAAVIEERKRAGAEERSRAVAAAQAEDERRRSQGWVRVMVPSASRFDGKPGQTVWQDGVPWTCPERVESFSPFMRLRPRRGTGFCIPGRNAA